jgi:hypothetical protein
MRGQCKPGAIAEALVNSAEFRPPLPISVGPVGAPYAFTKSDIRSPSHVGRADALLQAGPKPFLAEALT